MKIALFQFDITWEDKEKNFVKVSHLMNKIKKQKVDLVILPELFSTGYTMSSVQLAEGASGETPRFLSELARDNNTYVLGSFIKETKGKPQNVATLYNRSGDHVLDYAKIHLFTGLGEHKNYEPGKSIAVFELEKQKIGVAICYDLRFPELFRKLSDQGVKCTVVPASWHDERIHHWDLLLRARAMDNQMFMIGVNRVGKSPLGNYTGHSAIAGPDGSVLKSTKPNHEEVLIYDLDFGIIEQYRKELPWLTHRVFP